MELLLFYAIPQKDTNDLSHELLERFGSLAGVLEAPAAQIQAVSGMGECSALLFPVLMDLYRRYMKQKSMEDPTPLGDVLPESVGARYSAQYAGLDREVVTLVGLNRNMRILGDCVIGEGTSVSAPLNLSKAAEFVSQYKPYYAVLIHNHPSGVSLPSPSDFNATDQLKLFLHHLGVILTDHLIYDGNGDYLSFRDSKFFDLNAYPKYDVTVGSSSGGEELPPFGSGSSRKSKL